MRSVLRAGQLSMRHAVSHRWMQHEYSVSTERHPTYLIAQASSAGVCFIPLLRLKLHEAPAQVLVSQNAYWSL
jgi:hypothetical protein